MTTTIELLPKQDEILFEEIAFLGVMGGLGSSKTHISAVYCLHMLRKYPGIWGALGSGTYKQLMKSADAAFKRHLALVGWRDRREYRYSAGDKVYRLPNGSELHLTSMNVSPGELKGPEYGFIVLDEADTVDEEHWRIFKGRARQPGYPCHRRVFGNGAPPAHWFARDFEGSRALPEHRLMHMSTYDNRRFLGDAEIRRYEATYPPGSLDHRRWMMGDVVALAGAVYPEFNTAIHLIDESELPTLMHMAHGLDLGTIDPNVMIIGGLDRLGRLFIIGEYYSPTNTAVQELNRDAGALQRDLGTAGWPIFSDHSATARAGLAFEGMFTELADKDVKRGIDFVRKRLRDKTLFIVKGRAPMLVEQLQLYEWAKGMGGVEKPAHAYSHAPDALRYLVMGFDGDRQINGWRDLADSW